MGEGAAGRDVERVDAGRLQPLRDLNGILHRVPGGFERQQRVVVIGRRDLHL